MLRYDRSIGANVYDPSGGPNEADQGNAMQALARALGFYNEASDLGTAANFGNPQQAAAVLGQLFQGEQAKLDRQNKLNALAMQQSGQAAIQEARLAQAAQEAAASRDLTRWGKQGDWQRYDRQYAAQRDVAREKALADMLRQQGIEVGRDRRAQERNRNNLQVAETYVNKPQKPQAIPKMDKDVLRKAIMNERQRLIQWKVPKDKWPTEAQLAAEIQANWQARLSQQQQQPKVPGPPQPDEEWDGFGPEDQYDYEDRGNERLQRILGTRQGW
jgi:hypothetical protein